MKKFVKSILLLPLLMAGVSCYDTDNNDTTPTNPTPSTPTVVKVTGVTLDTTSKTIEIGSTFTLTPTVAPNNATNKGVTWSSSNTSVATVSNSGVVTAVAVGKATITVTTNDGKYTSTCVVNVSSLVVEKDEIKVLVDPDLGDTKKIVVTAAPSTDTITYSSSNEEVATVSEDGVITGVTANETCTITVKSSSNITKEITVKTYDVENYFTFDGAKITGIVDYDVVNLKFPTFNPTTSEAITTIGATFATEFHPMLKLEKIYLPEQTITLENSSFSGYAPLCKYLYMPATVTTAGGSALSGLCNLETIDFVGNDTLAVSTSEYGSILYGVGNKRVFKGYNHPNGQLFDSSIGITDIWYSAYVYQDSLTNVELPEGVVRIRSGFVSNQNLKSISFPSSFTNFGTFSTTSATWNVGVLYGSPELETITVNSSNTSVTSQDANGEELNGVFVKDSSQMRLLLGCKNTELEATFTGGLKLGMIDNFSFDGRGLEGTIILPDSVKTIGNRSFAFNENLKGIYLSSNVSSIFSMTYRATGFALEDNYSMGKFTQYLAFTDENGIPRTYNYLSSVVGENEIAGPFVSCSSDFKIYYQTGFNTNIFTDNVKVLGPNASVTTVEVTDSSLTLVE